MRFIYIWIIIINLSFSLEINKEIGLAYQYHKTKNSIGSEMAFTTNLGAKKDFFSWSIGANLFSSLGNGKQNSNGIPFFGDENQNYAILSELYLEKRFLNSTLTLGRQKIQTPFAGMDEGTGVAINTFEGVVLENRSLKDTTITLGHLYKWAGVDSNKANVFTKLNNSNGLQFLGINYKDTISTYYYYLKDFVNIVYIDGTYTFKSGNFDYEIVAQFALQNYKESKDSKIYGISWKTGYEDIALIVAYNKTQGESAENFFGGGPFVTNAQHNTLKEAGRDGKTLLFTLEYSLFDNLNLIGSIDAHRGKKNNSREYDLGVEYSYNENIDFTAIYSDIKDKEEDFQNLRLFLNYKF